MSRSTSSSETDDLNEVTRAEDILLGSLGYGEGASIIAVESTSSGYAGTAQWDDGQIFEFRSEEELSDLEAWALEVLSAASRRSRRVS